MQAGSLYLLLHTRSGSIPFYLFYSFQPLCFGFSIEIFGRQIFQFKDIAVRHFTVALQVGHEKEITETMVQLHFRGSQVVGVHAEIGGEKALYVAFAFDGAAHGRILFVGTGYELQRLAPMTIESHTIK